METNVFHTRKGHRIEQMVIRWLRRSRESSLRGRNSTGDSPTLGSNQFSCSIKLNVVIQKDLLLSNYGFDISQIPPLTVTAVTAGSPADGKLFLGDQILKINNENVENIPTEDAANIVRKSGETVTVTVLRNTLSPKSSFLTAEKRAKLKSNPVKVRFAEEVIVNGHTQGNSLLFMPNVLKVYLENGQTKAFKFERKTTVKDIILTLKEKLSINIIEHFALALEEQYNISKIFLLHEDELIEQVVQKKESHDYRCLFRVCFVPKEPMHLLQEDPVGFEYLYLQSCSDVLQERFAVEMKCSVALRLAALHIQERIQTCGQPQKISFKYIEKDWGIDNFLSPTLLRSLRGKDIKKAISFHMKRNQCILEPRQKQTIPASQVRLNYLKILGDLKTYGGKVFNATLMLQDRESYVTLLVGAKYGISQIINNKLNIMTCLAEFSNISKIELTLESEKVSMVKVYLQDVKPLSLLLESNNAKDIACLISGYCKLFVDSTNSIFHWPGCIQMHRVSTEEGYESRACSDSEESSEFDSSLELSSDLRILKQQNINPLHEEDEEEDEEELKENVKEYKQDGETENFDAGERGCCDGGNNDTESISETSDSANTLSQGYKISWSSDSIDALEEDDLETCSSSRPEFFQFYDPSLKDMTMEHQGVFNDTQELKVNGDGQIESDPFLCFLQLPKCRVNTPHANDISESTRDTEGREDCELHSFSVVGPLIENTVMEYYSLCSNVSPDSSVDKNTPSSPENISIKDQIPEIEINGHIHYHRLNDVEMLILDPPPGFGDSSSEEEFYDATDRFTPTQISPGPNFKMEQTKFPYPDNVTLKEPHAPEKYKKQFYTKMPDKCLRKRRSFLKTDYTSQVTFPLLASDASAIQDHIFCFESHLPAESHSPTVSSLNDTEGEPVLLESKKLVQLKSTAKTKSRAHSPSLMEMEPDTMETKSVTDSVVSSICAFRFRYDQKMAHSHSHNGEYSTKLAMKEISDLASPSQISLQFENINTNVQSDLFAEKFSFDKDFGTEITTTFKNLFEEEGADEELDKQKGLDFKNPQIHNEQFSQMNCPPKSDSTEYNLKMDTFSFFNGNNATYNTETKKCFRSTTKIPFEEKANVIISNRNNGSSCAEGMFSEEASLVCMDSLNIKNCCSGNNTDFLSMAPCTSSGMMDTLELCYNHSIDFSQNSEKKRSDKSLSKNGQLPNTQTSTHNERDSANISYLPNYDPLLTEDGCYSLEISEQERSEIPKVGNCGCQLSYTSCFRGGDPLTDDVTTDNAVIVPSLPTTTPPVSQNALFLKGCSVSSTSNNKHCLQKCNASFNYLKDNVCDAPAGFDKLEDSVLDLQKIIEENQNNTEVHSPDKCAAIFLEQKSSLCSVSTKLVYSSQKVVRPEQSPKEMYKTMTETFFSLLQVTEVCLQFSKCNQCSKRQRDVQTNLSDVICSYRHMVQAAKKALQCESRDMHLKLLSWQCTSLTAAVFCLTQQFRTLIFP
ncbi:hypothetical protein GDO86_001262 [Hymenochirus boettgeri]|uniref:FERM and PDZ domain-containing protein 1 n=1 Tax=Hymenochirus boettgeri TaxID=247094 RepID=A0A8T2KF39_9PIPI|nr:hypothetical protein GDO86_001262 [Hymenochirus boettgeri]